MPLQKIQLYIVLMFAFSSAFGSPVNWRGRYTDELYREGLTRFRPFPSPWISDLEQGLDFGSGWVLYKQSQNVGTPDIGDDIFAFYLSPRWRQVLPVIVEDTGVIEEEQISNRRFLKKWALPLEPELLRQQRMVLIPAGEFLMGTNDPFANDMQPVRTVYVDAFYMDTTEVTNADFKAFVDANPAWQKDRIEARFANENYLRHWTSNHYPEGSGNLPVTHVSWYSAMAYAEWVGKRLPTEAEWEYAARGGLVGKTYPNGDTMTPKDANYNSHQTTMVARYAANGYGLYDMAGNVWEWCLDAYHEAFYATFPQEGVAQNPLSGANDVEWLLKNWRTAQGERVLRGGCFLNRTSSLRVAFRNKVYGEWSHNAFGFRCARSLTPKN